MKHQHIKYKDLRWTSTVWQCECGFKSKFLTEFDAHLEEKSNKLVEPTAKVVPICSCGPWSENGLSDDCPIHG